MQNAVCHAIELLRKCERVERASIGRPFWYDRETTAYFDDGSDELSRCLPVGPPHPLRSRFGQTYIARSVSGARQLREMRMRLASSLERAPSLIREACGEAGRDPSVVILAGEAADEARSAGQNLLAWEDALPKDKVSFDNLFLCYAEFVGSPPTKLDGTERLKELVESRIKVCQDAILHLQPFEQATDGASMWSQFKTPGAWLEILNKTYPMSRETLRRMTVGKHKIKLTKHPQSSRTAVSFALRDLRAIGYDGE